MQSQRLTWSQSTIEHQVPQSSIAEAPELTQQRINLVLAHRTWQPIHGLDAQHSRHGLPARYSLEKRPMPFGDTRDRTIDNTREWVRAIETSSQDRPIVEGRNGGKRSVHGRRRQPSRGPQSVRAGQLQAERRAASL